MAELRRVLENAGMTGVTTYLQSGNAFFDATGSRLGVRDDLRALISGAFGFDVPLILVTGDELETVIADCPYRSEAAADPTKVHVTFLDPMPAAEAWSVVDESAIAPERLAVGRGVVYMHLPNGMGRATLPDLTAKAASRVVATTRNWRTVTTLAAMFG